MQAIAHNFNKSLKSSHAADELPLWEEAYRKMFPDFVACHSVRAEGEHQRAGIDRIIVLACGKIVTVDEKIRGRNKITGKVYEDIALEYKHVYDNGRVTQGWVLKPLLCDYIAYAIAPIGKCYLLPTLQLRTAFRENQGVWLATKKIIEARNVGYTSYSVTLTVKELFIAIGRSLRSTFTPMEIAE